MKLINPEIRIETTNKCNANCIYCARDKMTRPKKTMPYDHFKYLVTQADGLNVYTISPFGFGEPLLDNEIVDKVYLCHSNGFETFLTSNGSLLTRGLGIKLLQAGLSHIRFSFHELFPSPYGAVHKGLKFSETLENILAFINNKKKYDYVNCKISISMMPSNPEDIETLINFWQPMVDYLEIWKPHNWANKKLYRRSDALSYKKLKSCGRPFNGPVQIQADGTVIPCCFITNSEIVLGNTYENTIEEILKGDKFNAFRWRHETGNLKGLVCETCDQRNIEDENPLLYSNRDPEKNINTTSSIKWRINKNGFNNN